MSKTELDIIEREHLDPANEAAGIDRMLDAINTDAELDLAYARAVVDALGGDGEAVADEEQDEDRFDFSRQ